MRVTLVILGGLLAARPAVAQPAGDAPAATGASADPEDRCKAALVARGTTPAAPYCQFLAVDVVTATLHAARAKPAARAKVAAVIASQAMQPRITDTPGAQASAAQTTAIASGEPVGAVGGSVAAVGDTGQGLQLVTSLAINPASIVLGDTSEQGVWVSRLADLSVVLPMDVEPASASKGFRYIGARFRLNTLAALHSAELEHAIAGYQMLQPLIATLLPKVTAALQSAPDPGRCAAAIQSTSEADQVTACGGVLMDGELSTVAVAARAALAQFREDTDRKYLSLEARFDRGDLNADAAANKDSLLAAYLAAGYGLNATADGSTLELRARGGVVYFHDGATDQSRSALYGAFGVEAAVVRDLKRYTLSAALELTKQWGSDPMPPSTGVDALRFGAAIPLTDGKVVSVGITIPLHGGESTIALSGDWSLLLGK